MLVTLADGTALELSTARPDAHAAARRAARRAGRGRRGGVGRGGRGRPVHRNGRGCPGRRSRLRRRAAGHGGRPRQAGRLLLRRATCGRGTTSSPSTWPARARSPSRGSAGAPDEFAALLTERLREARNRTSAFLGSLLPGLDPMALRAAAGLLRDGVAVRARALDAIHPDLSATLLRVATLPGRLAARVRPRRAGGPGDRLQAGDLGPPGGGRPHALAGPVRDAAHRPARDPRRAVRPRPRRRAGGRRHVGHGAGRRSRRLRLGRLRRVRRLRRAVRRRPRRLRRLLGVPRARRGDELELRRRPPADGPAGQRPLGPAHPGNRGPGRADHVGRRTRPSSPSPCWPRPAAATRWPTRS